MKEAIRAGINIVHINTELRLAWKRGLKDGLSSNDSEIAPYTLLPPAVASVQQVVSARLKIFNAAET